MFLSKAAALGVVLDDESKRGLGNILEACKFFYCAGPAPAPKKKAPSKKKAEPKSKSE